jgi:hypothetical protein
MNGVFKRLNVQEEAAIWIPIKLSLSLIAVFCLSTPPFSRFVLPSIYWFSKQSQM